MGLFSVRAGKDRVVLLPIKGPVKAASTAVIGSGLTTLDAVVIAHVDDLREDEDPREVAKEAALSEGLDPRRAAVFLTAADLGKSIAWSEGGRVFAAVSVGLHPLSCVGGGPGGRGTIIMVVGVDECMDDGALLEILHVAGAVKAAALQSLGAGCGKGACIGTVTDAVLAASLPCGGGRYAGPATRVGAEVVRLLFTLITEKVAELADTSTRLGWLVGMGVSEFVDAAVSVYRRAPVPGVGETLVRGLIKEELGTALRDPNVWALLMASKFLDDAGVAGGIPGLGRGDYLADSKAVLADEVIGLGLALYVNGLRGLFSYYWVDRLKEEVAGLADLPMFSDDAAAALIGSVLSRVYDRVLRDARGDHGRG